jgi:GntR family transcriptional regulator, transcriptional repressor for pyruvate dehydrogenase complex
VTQPRARTHEAVLRHITGRLESRSLRTGDRLPPERQLADQLGVSRPSVREAIRVLEAMGVVRTSVGSGPMAGAVIVADAAAGITSALRLHLATETLPRQDVVQTRLLLESWSVREAARRGDAGALLRSEGFLDRMDVVGLSPDEFHRLDAEFHVELARATGNVVVAAIMESLRESIHGYVMAAVPLLDDWSLVSRGLRREHRRILAAVRAGDGDAANRLVTRHIEGYYRRVEFH